LLHPDNTFTWDSFYLNVDSTNCPITSCALFDGGSCGSGTYSGATDVFMDASAPWHITMSVTEPAGYSWSTCVRCSNGAQTIDLDNWLMTQTPLDCSSTMTPGSDIVSSRSYGGATATAFVRGGEWNTYFQNTDETNCPITSCSLWEAGSCGVTSFVSTNVYIESALPWRIYSEENVLAGYSHSICVRCSNGQQDVDSDNWDIS